MSELQSVSSQKHTHHAVHITRTFERERLTSIEDSLSQLLKGTDHRHFKVSLTEDGFIEFSCDSASVVPVHALKRYLSQENIMEADSLTKRVLNYSDRPGVESEPGNFTRVSFIVAPIEINLGELYKRTIKDLNPDHLSRHQLVRLIDPERLAAFWDINEFLEKHREQIVEANARKLMKAVSSGATIIINEKELIERHGNEAVKAKGFIPDRIEYFEDGKVKFRDEHYLSFKFSDHRFFVDGQPYIVISNDRVNPEFPRGVGSGARKDEVHTVKAVIMEHICEAGINKKQHPDEHIYGFIEGKPSSLPGSKIVKPNYDMARAIAEQYQGKIESLMDGSLSAFHFDINTGRVITRSLVAGLEPRLLSAKISDSDLRAVYSEQQQENKFHDDDKSGRKWKNQIRHETGLLKPYVMISLRTQFSGLSSRFIQIPDRTDRTFLTSPVFKNLNSGI